MHILLVGVAIFWLIALFCDTIFKTCMFHPYIKALQMSGLDIKPLLIHLHITRFNRYINQMGRWRPLQLQRWFDIGAFVTSIIVFPAMILYIVSLNQMFKSSSIYDYDNALLLPVIPGYNFPLSHFLYYIIIILLCSVFHEFGHALAASRERISIDVCGFALFAVFPLAFVKLRFDQFKQISLWQQLRILCAGIWHNIILSFLALGLWYSTFFIFAPVFHIGSGVSVLEVHQLSGLNRPAGLEAGDHIYEISGCKVQNRESWSNCLKQLAEFHQCGFCVPEKLKLQSINSRSLKSCVNSSEYLPFQVPGFGTDGICFQARQVVENFIFCNQTVDCEKGFDCIFPILPSESYRFVAVQRHHKPPVLFEGSMIELSSDVEVSNFVSKFNLLPANVAECFITLLEYIIMFSSGLAVMNLLPVFNFDGQFIIENLVHLCLQKYIPRYDIRQGIFNVISGIGFILLFSIIFLSAYKFYTFS